MINIEIEVKKVSEVRDPVTVWDNVLKNSSYTWYMGGYYYHTYAQTTAWFQKSRVAVASPLPRGSQNPHKDPQHREKHLPLHK